MVIKFKLLKLTLSITQDEKLNVIITDSDEGREPYPYRAQSNLPFYDSDSKKDYSVVILKILSLTSLNERRILSGYFKEEEVDWMRRKQLIDDTSQLKTDI